MMGVVIGVLPKFSIVPWVIGLVAMLLPLNLVTLILTVVICSFVGPLLDPLLHQVGYQVLTEPSLQGFWKSMALSDTFIWLQLNNTVVAGSVVVWLATLLPGFFVCKGIVFAARRYGIVSLVNLLGPAAISR